MSTTPTTSTWKARIAKLWSESQKIAEWRLPFALFACGLLAYGAAFAWHTLTTFDLVNLIRDMSYDDSFYYFQIAYNLSQGKFSTADGGITQTNGYHPIWLLLVTPFYWLFDKETALFGIKALEIMLVAGGATLIALAAWMSRLAWPLLFAALPMLYRNPLELLGGMETAPALFMLALLILVVCLYIRAPERWKWHLAALAFALIWVRIEYIAISLAVTAALCVIEWSRQERRSLRLSELANLRRAYIPLVGAMAGMLVYFAYNGLVFGGIMPVSGATKLAWAQAYWEQQGGYDFLENIRYMIWLDGAFDYELLIALEICAYLLIAWRFALRSNDRRDWLLTAFLVGAFGLAAGHIAKFAQSVLTVQPNGNHLWYFVPAYLMTALIIPVRLYIAIYLIRRFIAPRRRIAANTLAVGVVVIGAALLLARADFAEPFRWVDQKSKSTTRYWKLPAYMGAQVMNRALPEGSVIGSWSSGIIGYFSRFPVVNLDGLVNSYDYLRHPHTEDGDLYWRYGITHFAEMLLHYQIKNNAIFEGAPDNTPHIEYRFTLWTHDPETDAHAEIDYSQQVWDNMQPQFNYLAGDVGVVLAGRTAQAFAIDCPPHQPFIWTWTEPQHERTVRSKSVPYRTHANLCGDARILPRSAGHPALAEMRTSSAYPNVDPEQLANREPIIRSNFNVHLIDRSLIFSKSACAQTDVEPRFFASVFPVDTNDLSDDRRQRGYHNLDFHFHDYGATAANGLCWATIHLPNYPIAEIHAGQYVEAADGYAHIWVGTYNVPADADRIGANADLEMFETLAGREPVIRSRFNVYIIGDRLIYAKTDCDQEDTAARFYVSIDPLYADDLPDNRAQSGYDAIEFNFHDYGAIAADGQCWTQTSLPNYPIAELRTGQYEEVADGYNYLWESAYRFD